RVSNLTLTTLLEDERPAIVLDDVDTAALPGLKAAVKRGVPVVVRVTNTRKRDAGREYVKDLAYRTTSVRELTVGPGILVQPATVDRPAPGTPPDSFYASPTAPTVAQPYSYRVP